eukprot:CAMPEP_0178986176 /NCGR_PEP_ID=MMETSP0795-20121207/2566_1 /TAXON_ID=88552 /ORGANISM="Amoebophrya sp., Strain Ameob2" /LENGTH=449 /DNA_ID=CAMNT_0020677223 /DNA_START=232 /DNA_END=1578 /DNA_ORIENTATION=+
MKMGQKKDTKNCGVADPDVEQLQQGEEEDLLAAQPHDDGEDPSGGSDGESGGAKGLKGGRGKAELRDAAAALARSLSGVEWVKLTDRERVADCLQRENYQDLEAVFRGMWQRKESKEMWQIVEEYLLKHEHTFPKSNARNNVYEDSKKETQKTKARHFYNLGAGVLPPVRKALERDVHGPGEGALPAAHGGHERVQRAGGREGIRKRAVLEQRDHAEPERDDQGPLRQGQPGAVAGNGVRQLRRGRHLGVRPGGNREGEMPMAEREGPAEPGHGAGDGRERAGLRDDAAEAAAQKLHRRDHRRRRVAEDGRGAAAVHKIGGADAVPAREGVPLRARLPGPAPARNGAGVPDEIQGRGKPAKELRGIDITGWMSPDDADFVIKWCADHQEEMAKEGYKRFIAVQYPHQCATSQRIGVGSAAAAATFGFTRLTDPAYEPSREKAEADFREV